MTGRLVGDDGSLSARIVVVGEAPGATEVAQGKPFVGASGWALKEWMGNVGLQRADAYWTNCYPFQPVGNDIKTVPVADLDAWVDQLHDRLAALHDPWLIVPTGNTALRALTGKVGITKHRGSIYQYEDRRGRKIKVIPTIHPAATFRTPGWSRRCQRDWGRIAGDALFRDLRLPRREHFTRPSLSDVEGFVHDAAAHAEKLAVDIETPGGDITCVGFSYDERFSITIPTTLAYWGSPDALARAWAAVKSLCESQAQKITHNGHFDAFWLASKGIRLVTWLWDTLALHHAIDATEDHALAYCASVDTREPYWKDEAKDPEEAAKYASNLEAFWVYNGKDACVTRELADVYIERLKADGRLDFYHQHYRRLFNPVLGMMQTGIRMDEQQRRRQYAALVSKSIQLQADLETLCGMPLHTTARNKKREAAGKIPDLSNAKIKTYLYDHLKLPVQRNRQTKKPTADEVTVRHMMLKWGQKALPVTAEASAFAQIAGAPLTFEVVGGKILEHRRTRKLMEFLDEGLLDDDGHIRYTFKFTTDTGRFACGKSPTMRRGQRTGRNIQNIDRELRGVFLPEPGCVFVEVDLSQAEDRIVKMLAAAVTGNEPLRERARAKPWENDEHKRAASVIFNTQISAVSKPQRQMGKRVRHATNYDMHGKTMSEGLMKDGIVETPDECDRMINALHAADPDIRLWQADTRRLVMNHRCLINSWGRELLFEDSRLDDDAYRRAYAFIPQSEVPGIINSYGLVPLHTKIKTEGWRTVIHLQGHDSLLMSCPPDEVWPVMSFLRTVLERPRIIGRQPLTIWTEFKCGLTWGNMREWKMPPTRDEVLTAVEEMTRAAGS